MKQCERNGESKLALAELADFIHGKNDWRPTHKQQIGLQQQPNPLPGTSLLAQQQLQQQQQQQQQEESRYQNLSSEEIARKYSGVFISDIPINNYFFGNIIEFLIKNEYEQANTQAEQAK